MLKRRAGLAGNFTSSSSTNAKKVKVTNTNTKSLNNDDSDSDSEINDDDLKDIGLSDSEESKKEKDIGDDSNNNNGPGNQNLESTRNIPYHEKSPEDQLAIRKSHILRSFLSFNFHIAGPPLASSASASVDVLESQSKQNRSNQQVQQSENNVSDDTSRSLTIETFIKATLPSNLIVSNITPYYIELEQLRDDKQIEKDKLLKEAQTTMFSHIGGVLEEVDKDLFEMKYQLTVPNREEWPINEEVEEVLEDNESSLSDNCGVYLLTDCKSKLFITLGNVDPQVIGKSKESEGSGDSKPSQSDSNHNDYSNFRILGRVLSPLIGQEQDVSALLRLLLLLERPSWSLAIATVGSNSGGDSTSNSAKIKVDVSLDTTRLEMLDLEEKGKKLGLSNTKYRGLDLISQVLLQFQETAQGSPNRSLKQQLKYIPSDTFKGYKEGYVFKKDSLGLGYYEDIVYKKIWNASDESVDDESDEQLQTGEKQNGDANGATDTVTNGNGTTHSNGKTESPVPTTSRFFNFPLLTKNLEFQKSIKSLKTQSIKEEWDSNHNEVEKRTFSSYPILILNNNDDSQDSLGPMESIDYWLSARERETSALKSQEHTRFRASRCKSMDNELLKLLKELEKEIVDSKKSQEILMKKSEESDPTNRELSMEIQRVGSIQWNIERIKALRRFCDKFG